MPIAPRHEWLATLEDADVAALKARCSTVIEGAEDCAQYNRDWMNKWEGRARVVAQPATTAEVSAILKYCDARRLAVTTQGGKTGLVGGSVPVHDEVILSTTRLNAIDGLDEDTGVVTCGAGVVLDALDAHLRDRSFVAPLDLGASGTCTVGGNLATNAGGVRFVRHGSLRGACAGLEFVQADGTVVDCTSSLRKDNTGYALPQLLIGSEGTLCVITRCALACPALAPHVHVAWLACRSFEEVRRVLTVARAELGEILSAVEFLDGDALDATTRAHPAVADPLECDAPFRVLVETAGCHAAHDAAKLERFLEAVGAFVADGCVAPSQTAIEALWTLREGVSDAMTSRGFVYKYDVSLPPAVLYDLVEAAQAKLGGLDVDVAGYGHVGDANLHLNICDVAGYREEVHALLEPWVYESVAGAGGSISAEHGVGQCKSEYLHLNKPPAAIDLMGLIKRTMDPNLILNPYKVLPASALGV